MTASLSLPVDEAGFTAAYEAFCSDAEHPTVPGHEQSIAYMLQRAIYAYEAFKQCPAEVKPGQAEQVVQFREKLVF